MDIKKVIQNKGINPENGRKVKALFPTKIKSKGEKISEDIFDMEFAEWLERLYPTMIEEYGQEKIDTILYNYTYELIETYLSNSAGICRKNKISVCWYFKNLHEALTAFLHETGHATGGPFSHEKLLEAGYEDRESFFIKLEEAMVSERQNILEFGEFNTKYFDYFGSDGKIRRYHFKSRNFKYAHYQAYLEGLKILLGKSKGLIYENARSATIEEHDEIYAQIKAEMQTLLTEEQFISLANALNGAIIHLDYPDEDGSIRSKYKKIVVDLKIKTPEQFEERYKYNVEFARKHGKLNQTIDEDINDFCRLIIEVLKQRITDEKYDKVEALSQISRYIVMIRNYDESLEKVTNELIELWRSEISKINLNIMGMEDISLQEKEAIMHYILAVPGISYEDIKNIKLIKNQKNEMNMTIGSKGTFCITKGEIETEKHGVPYNDPFMCGIQFTNNYFIQDRNMPNNGTPSEEVR